MYTLKASPDFDKKVSDSYAKLGDQILFLLFPGSYPDIGEEIMNLSIGFCLITLLTCSCFSFLTTKTLRELERTGQPFKKDCSGQVVPNIARNPVSAAGKEACLTANTKSSSKSTEIRVYHKTTDGSHSKLSGEGWELHVLFVSGVSELEIYKKSQKISEFEMIYLLNFQSGGSYWKKSEESESPTDEPSAFGYDFIRNDGKVKAKNWVAIVSWSIRPNWIKDLPKR